MDLEDLRLAVYRAFADTGRPPTTEDLTERFGQSPETVQLGLRRLADTRHLALGADGRILMAHPFSAIPLGFAVMGARTLWWGGCAWDAFALPNLLSTEVLVSTRCPACSRAHAWNVGDQEPPEGDQVAHFLVPAARMWDDVVRTCGNQRIFCGPECVDRWLATTGDPRGYVMDLATLWRLAQHWYDGRLDRGYVRREPAEAAEYLSGVGLSGPFWGH
ncbi:organomercurial lyase [Actinocrispum wychmicini]|uniref:Alkylmercury lyase-like protein n=1 Tax=Actinocrispum wychmicini TaxID=1213861 RepID=A0A4V2S5I8_9PSEU|nr:organomercurial lyase [Actinocrispum wychmicini]TCO52280.1 alkylmercury lyase-like protein [Actinocrispum wychmicini]